MMNSMPLLQYTNTFSSFNEAFVLVDFATACKRLFLNSPVTWQSNQGELNRGWLSCEAQLTIYKSVCIFESLTKTKRNNKWIFFFFCKMANLRF